MSAREASDEMAADEEGGEPPGDPGEHARHADRDAHANRERDGAGDNPSGGS